MPGEERFSLSAEDGIPSAQGPMRTVSLAALTVLPCTPIQHLDVAVDVGFEAVSLRIFAVMDTDVDVMSDRRLQSAIRRRIEETKLQVLDVEVVRVTPGLDVAALEPALEFAGSIGARRFAVTPDAEGDYTAAAEAAVVRRLAELCVAAERHDLGVMLEFMAYRSIRSLRHAAAIVEKVGHPGLGITLDALHLFRSGGTVDDVRKLPSARVAAVQLCDAPAAPPFDLAREARYGRRYPGEGDLPLRELLTAVSPDVPISIEVPSRTQATQGPRERAQRARDSLAALNLL